MEARKVVKFCPHCGNRTPQDIIHTQEHWDDMDDESPLTFVYAVTVCGTCKEILVYHDHRDALGPRRDEWGNLPLVWPHSGQLPRAVPKAVAACYEEASHIKNIAPNAFANQLGRALEAICQDRGAGDGTLHTGLKVLVERGELPPILGEMTDVLRVLRNIGSHNSGRSVLRSHVGAMDRFFQLVIEYVYVAPSRLKEFQDSLERSGITKQGPTKARKSATGNSSDGRETATATSNGVSGKKEALPAA
jgi:hypothetical protein